MVEARNNKWVGSWTSTPAPVEGKALDGQTVRMIARVSIGGLFSLLSYSYVRTACQQLKNDGTFRWGENALAHPEMNGLMASG